MTLIFYMRLVRLFACGNLMLGLMNQTQIGSELTRFLVVDAMEIKLKQ
jgi:hypothetical protein